MAAAQIEPRWPTQSAGLLRPGPKTNGGLAMTVVGSSEPSRLEDVVGTVTSQRPRAAGPAKLNSSDGDGPLSQVSSAPMLKDLKNLMITVVAAVLFMGSCVAMLPVAVRLADPMTRQPLDSSDASPFPVLVVTGATGRVEMLGNPRQRPEPPPGLDVSGAAREEPGDPGISLAARAAKGWGWFLDSKGRGTIADAPAHTVALVRRRILGGRVRRRVNQNHTAVSETDRAGLRFRLWPACDRAQPGNVGAGPVSVATVSGEAGPARWPVNGERRS